MQRQTINEEMQKAKEEGQVPRQEDMEKVHGNMRKMPNRYSNINCMWYREPLKWGTRDITRLDIMAYLDPASNPGSKPQRLGATNCKSSTSDKLQKFRTIFGISCKFLRRPKTIYIHEITLFVLKENLMQEKSQNLSCK